MDEKDSTSFDVPLVYRVPKTANAEQMAEAMVAIWREADAAITSIISQKCSRSLHTRNLFLTRSPHSMLAAVRRGDPANVDLLALLVQLGRGASKAHAAQAGMALLQDLYTRVINPVGLRLTTRLLVVAWAKDSSAPSGRSTGT